MPLLVDILAIRSDEDYTESGGLPSMPVLPDDAIYFTGNRTFVASGRGSMSALSERIFAWLRRNAARPHRLLRPAHRPRRHARHPGRSLAAAAALGPGAQPSTARRYPRPGRVVITVGCAGSGSIFRRSRLMYTRT